MEKEPSKRTGQQNRALHKWFAMVAQALNDAGITQRKFFEYGIEIDWNENLVKGLWKGVQEDITGKRSTTELSKQGEIDLIYDTLNRALAEHGLHIPFPSYEPNFWDNAPLRGDNSDEAELI